MTKNNTHF